MKKLFYLFMFTFSLLVSGCEERDLNATEPEWTLACMKFKDPEYSEHIMVWHYDDTKKYNHLSMYPMDNFNSENYGSSPYTDLGNGYYYLDWDEWHLASFGSIIKPKWTEFEDCNKLWSLEDIYVKDPIEYYVYVSGEKAIKYQKEVMKLDDEDIFIPYLFASCIEDEDTDSIQEREIEILKDMIANGCILKYGNIHKRKRCAQ